MFPFYKKGDQGGFLSNTSRCEPFTFIVPQFIMEMSEIPRDIKDVGDVKTEFSEVRIIWCVAKGSLGTRESSLHNKPRKPMN